MLCKFTLNRLRPLRAAIFCFLSLVSVQAIGQNFPVATIPDSLKTDADAVVRLDEIRYEIKSVSEVTIYEHHVYTILNENGEAYASYVSSYNNKTSFISGISGYLYDASGKELMHFKKKDMEDRPAFDGSSFVNDERIKKGGFSYRHYPYTVSFEEEHELKDLIRISEWLPQTDNNLSVEKTICTIIAPSGYALRYRMLNSSLIPAIAQRSNRTSYSWELQNIKAFESEAYSPGLLAYTPFLMIGLGDIEMGNYKGSMTTWDSYARFYGSMQKGRDQLPEATKLKVHELIKGLTDPKAKIAVLYKYLQQNSHYVGIQLGIGGWQTYDAVYVATNKYGDCKALSNFMIALLKEAGIKSNAVVICGGPLRCDFVSDFSHDPFNHVICCVPLTGDTVWLECTSQSLSAGYLGRGTSNRFGLLIDDNGGSLVHTPAYLLHDNIQSRKIFAALNAEGNLDAKATTSYSAYCQDEIASVIHDYSKEDQLTWLKSVFHLPTYDIVSFGYKEDYSNRLPVIVETLELSVLNYAPITGRRIFINPDILTRSGAKMGIHENRKRLIEFSREFHYSDTVEILIPEGYQTESSPYDTSFQSRYGKYVCKTIVSGSKILYYRAQEQYSGRFPAGEYADVAKFYNDMYDADHNSIVLIKKK